MVDKADLEQVGGNHYKNVPPEYQHWSLVSIYGWDYFQATAIKYIIRYKNKNGIEDLKKARHYLDKMIEQEEKLKVSVDPPHEQLGDLLPNQVKPTGWEGFFYEGGSRDWDMFTCRSCRQTFKVKVTENPHTTHTCARLPNSAL